MMRPGPIPERAVVEPRVPFDVHGIRFKAFPVEHSLRAPAVGYRISTDRTSLFYAPDIVRIHDQKEALAGITLYVGDGASITRPIVRKRGDAFIGHASIRTSIGMVPARGCSRPSLHIAELKLFLVMSTAMNEAVASLGQQLGVAAKIAFDGMESIRLT